MKRYFIRCVGTFFSAFSVFFSVNRADSATPHYVYPGVYTLGNDKYTISVYTGSAWYVGWPNKNSPDVEEVSYKNEYLQLFNTPKGTRYFMPAVVDYNYSGSYYSAYTGLFVSAHSFYVPGSTYWSVPSGTRFGDPLGKQQLLQTDSWVIGIDLYYLPSSGPFTAAGCCYYTPPEHSPGSYGFSYSGDGRAQDVCPCFYTTADKMYTGVACDNYEGKDIDYCTGTSVTGIVGDLYTNWPAVVRDVYFCYTFSGCSEGVMYSTFNGDTYSGFSGCHLVRIPIPGLAGATYNDLDLIIGDDGEFNPALKSPMQCGGGELMFASCASGYTPKKYLFKTNPDGCFACPEAAGTKIYGTDYELSNDVVNSNSAVTGIGACLVMKPMSADDTGTFELTTAAGVAQSCSGIKE